MSYSPDATGVCALLPCPFCGGEAAPAKCTITRDRDIEGNKGTFTGYYVNCIYCGADNRGIAEGWRTPEQAAEKWNRRFALSETATSETDEAWYERETAAFKAWWESEGEKKFSASPTMAAGAGWLARAEAARSSPSATVTPTQEQWKAWADYACRRFKEETGKDLQAQAGS